VANKGANTYLTTVIAERYQRNGLNRAKSRGESGGSFRGGEKKMGSRRVIEKGDWENKSGRGGKLELM